MGHAHVPVLSPLLPRVLRRMRVAGRPPRTRRAGYAGGASRVVPYPSGKRGVFPEGCTGRWAYWFSSLSVSTMLSLRIIAPETIMVPKTIARMPTTQPRIAPQGRVKAKVLTPSNW